MSLSQLETLCRTHHAQYDRVNDHSLYMAAIATSGRVHGVYLGEGTKNGYVSVAVQFSLDKKKIPEPERLCASVCGILEGDLAVAFSESTKTFYLSASLPLGDFMNNIDMFVDYCDSFSGLLEMIHQNGWWNNYSYALVFATPSTLH